MPDVSTANGRAVDDPDATERFVYQPALDGLRAFAVAIVVAFHYPPETARTFRGGFLGVDAFFVLSGFLITTLLVDEFRRTGSLRLRKFYARRALRLFPAASVLLAIGCVMWLFLKHSAPARPQGVGLIGVAAYVANWVQIWKPGSLGELSHTWSLAIEEQFYLMWPLALLFLLRRGARMRALLAVIGTGIVASATWRIIVWRRAPLPHTSFVNYYLHATSHVTPPAANARLHLIHAWDRWYFGTDTRADALLAGCFVAVVLAYTRGRIPARATRALRIGTVPALLGALLIIWRAEVFTSGWVPNWGVLAFEVCIAVVIAGLITSPRSGAGQVLAIPPLVWIGRRSYAIYLFHPIIFRFLNNEVYDITWAQAFVLSIAAVIAAAEISYRLIETPALRLRTRFASEPAAE
jgi:peptidoglycan/LPS O-acetylase OafA/YrhL